MAVERLSRGWLIVSAVVALVALLGLGASMTFVVSLLEAADTRWAALPFIGSALSSIVLVGAVPVLKSRPVARWARIAIPLFVGIFSLVAAGATWVLTTLFACDVDGLCRPVDTWKALPVFLAGAVLAAAGPGLAAIVSKDDHRGRWWAATVVAGLLAFVVSLFAWVEVGLYPLS